MRAVQPGLHTDLAAGTSREAHQKSRRASTSTVPESLNCEQLPGITDGSIGVFVHAAVKARQ